MADITIDFVTPPDVTINYQATQWLAWPPWSSTLDWLSDVIINTPLTWQALVFDSFTNTWINWSITGWGWLTWQIITSDQSLVWMNWYFTNWNSRIILTLTPTAIIWSIVQVSAYNSNWWRIGQNSWQKIFAGDVSTTIWATWYIESNSIGDTIELICINNNEWKILTIQWNLTII
jgi:hypothetical protein